ncbi:MAG: 50S ribosomal protein L25/general stress protein Ctc [Acidobacteria bacterium]|nr:50S ribosomal protein L25/general stress protein Ctc [Acidobacteriota bacterium]
MEATLSAVKRDTRGKNEARRLRAAGRIPAVLYGGESESLAVAVDPKLLSRILHSDSGVNTLIALDVEGETTRVIVKDYLLDPVKHHLLHADFYRVKMDQLITVTVPIELTGEAKGVKQLGGVLDFVHREVEIECLPGEIPESIEVDVTDFVIGQSVRLRELAENARWKPVSDPDTLILHVVAPRVVAETTEAAPTTTAEPEVIKKGKAEKGADAE